MANNPHSDLMGVQDPQSYLIEEACHFILRRAEEESILTPKVETSTPVDPGDIWGMLATHRTDYITLQAPGRYTPHFLQMCFGGLCAGGYKSAVESCLDDPPTKDTLYRHSHVLLAGLIDAARYGQTEVVKLLLPHIPKAHEQDVLYAASGGGHTDVARLLRKCIPPKGWGVIDYHYKTVTKPCERGHLSFVRYLFEVGGLQMWRIAIKYAVKGGHESIIRFLLADAEKRGGEKKLRHLANYALIHSFEYGRLEQYKAFLLTKTSLSEAVKKALKVLGPGAAEAFAGQLH